MCVYLKIRGSKYTKQKVIDRKREIGKFTIIHRNFNAPLSVMKKTSRKKK